MPLVWCPPVGQCRRPELGTRPAATPGEGGAYDRPLMSTRPSPDRLAVWRSFLEAHAAITQVLAAELDAERELPISWYDVLLQLTEAGGRLRMQELAGRLVVNKSSLTRLIDRIEAAGYVEREPSPEDGRGQYAVHHPRGPRGAATSSADPFAGCAGALRAVPDRHRRRGVAARSSPSCRAPPTPRRAQSA